MDDPLSGERPLWTRRDRRRIHQMEATCEVDEMSTSSVKPASGATNLHQDLGVVSSDRLAGVQNATEYSGSNSREPFVGRSIQGPPFRKCLRNKSYLGATHPMCLALILSIASLSIINQPYQAFGAQANTDVIQQSQTAKQHQQQPQLTANHRFKYPPQLQQIQHKAALTFTTTTTAKDSPEAVDGSAQKLSRTRRNLVRLELNPDLLLQLKLKPLPLPMPPPPSPPSQAATGELSSRTSGVENFAEDELTEKRKRSLDLERFRPSLVTDWSQATTTTTAATTSTTPEPLANSQSSELPVHAGRHDLLAFAWREAKRVLLLSSMAPAILQAKLERRFADLSTEASSATSQPNAKLQNGLPETRMDVDGGAETSGNSLVTSAFNDSAAVSSTQLQADNYTPELTSEVRRQRHNSQQIQGLGEEQAGLLGDDSRMQAMAAAMLPLFWPSFQLGSHGATTQQQPVIAVNESPTPAPVGGWLLKYTQLDRGSKQSLDADFHETIPRDSDDPNVDEQQPQAKVRTKRRKPSYLMQPGANSKQNQVSSTPYPESIRLASKYPLPKIKFQPQDLGATAPMTTTTTAARPTSAPHAAMGKPSSLPKSLSRLIEHQLMHNASSLLAHYRATAGASGLAPSTSVSKVVRMRNNTDQLHIVKLQPTEVSHRPEAFDLHRHPTTTTSTPSLSTTNYPATTTTTSTSTNAPIVSPPLRPRLKTTTTTTTPPPVTTLMPKQRQTSTGAASLKKKRPAAAKSPRPTEPSAPYKTIPAPTSTQRPMGADLDGGNKVLPEVREAKGDMLSKLASKRQRHPFGAGSSVNSVNDKNTVKLFHFKRKPDMKKLPFYKKPLNYTELGWTQEQIQEHLASQAAASSESGEGESLEGNGSNQGDRQLQEQPADNNNSGGEGAGDKEENLFARQKRRRRGKNHFERLMAELHSTTSDVSKMPESVQKDKRAAGPEEGDEVSSAVNEKQARTGPVMKIKGEPQAVQPAQLPLAGGQRRQSTNNGTNTEPAATSVSGAVQKSQNHSSDHTRGASESGGEQLQMVENNNNRTTSKPIIRKRRKHHGDQPLAAHSLPVRHQWRPSKPLGSAWDPTPGERLLLVPSSILTPSGSQLVPLFAGEDQADLGELDSSAWQPARQDWQRSPQQILEAADSKSSDGIAPSGEESYLQAPLNNQNSNGNSMSKKQAQVITQQQSEIRVPKLLSKPMRPAKYSLNGYIPKPTLAQQQQMQSMVATAPQQQLVEQQPNGLQAQFAITMTTNNSLKPKLRAPLLNGKDLDPATSDKVFSRRRGLQLHQRSISGLLQNGAGNSSSNKLSFQSLLSSSDRDARSRQLEENRRKYMVQPTRAPILSMHKVNMIKAKLGLTSPQTDGNKTAINQEQQIRAGQLLSDAPTTSRVGDKDQQMASQLVSNAQPLSSIPKTDFECTDSKGKFVAGLFADQKTGCQVWHLCSNNRKYSFLCPSGTIFNAKLRICDWRYNVKC